MAFGYDADRNQGLKLLTYTVPVLDVARAVLAAVKKDHLMGEVFNIGPASPLQGRDIKKALNDPAAVMEKYYPGCLPYLEKAGQTLDPAFFWPVTSIRKARLILDWSPQYTFDHWLREQGWTPPAR
jgi:nucleoside-diphosphate-sugar epimerase